MNQKQAHIKKEKLWIFPIVLIVVVVALWLTSLVLLNGQAERGTWGDMFGGVNALFSGLALAGIIYAIILQQKELTLARKEVREQKFDGIFFQLLRLHNDIVNSIDLDKLANSSKITGRDCFRVIRGEIITAWPKKADQVSEDVRADIQTAYSKVFKKYQSDLGHYCRNVYNLIKFVDEEQELKKPEKQKYINLFKAQLSSDELVILFYNNLSSYGSEKFKPLSEEYALFKNLDEFNLIHERHRSQYKESAYSYTKENES